VVGGWWCKWAIGKHWGQVEALLGGLVLVQAPVPAPVVVAGGWSW
jgi:hypothetical protein